MRIKLFLRVIILCVFTGILSFPRILLAENQKLKTQAPLFDNLGSFHFPVSTKVPLAQRFFDQGLVLYYENLLQFHLSH